jgi:hypothetical protein
MSRWHLRVLFWSMALWIAVATLVVQALRS